MPRRRHIKRAEPESNLRKCWVGFVRVLKKCLPFCCCFTDRILKTAIEAGANTLPFGKMITPIGKLVDEVTENGEPVAKAALDQLETLGNNNAPTNHPNITIVADNVETGANFTIDTAGTVITILANNALNKVGASELIPVVQGGINTITDTTKDFVDNAIIANVEDVVYKVADNILGEEDKTKEDQNNKINTSPPPSTKMNIFTKVAHAIEDIEKATGDIFCDG